MATLCASLVLCAPLAAQTLDLPPRPAAALSGTEFARRITGLGLPERDTETLAQITSGNVPDFLRKLVPVSVTNVVDGLTNTATFYVTPDYLAVGSDEDYFLTPMSPNTAQRIADFTHCSLPDAKDGGPGLCRRPSEAGAGADPAQRRDDHRAGLQQPQCNRARPAGGALGSAPARGARGRSSEGRGDHGEARIGSGEGGDLRLAPDQRHAHPAAVSEAYRIVGRLQPVHSARAAARCSSTAPRRP